jgi:hypothetical protein
MGNMELKNCLIVGKVSVWISTCLWDLNFESIVCYEISEFAESSYTHMSLWITIDALPFLKCIIKCWEDFFFFIGVFLRVRKVDIKEF